MHVVSAQDALRMLCPRMQVHGRDANTPQTPWVMSDPLLCSKAQYWAARSTQGAPAPERREKLL